jgi:formylglycine-generating enzyme required for sulfatase activity
MNMKCFLRAVIAIFGLAVVVPASAQCTGDLTGNGIVDGADLGTILAYWGPRTQDPTSIASDLNGDGLIDGADLGVLLASWGPCPSTITGLTPNQGCIVGGTQITISGTNLGSTSAISIGGAPATNFMVVNQNTVQATTPAGALGPVNVGVTTAAGTITAPQQFTYMPPSVSSIMPNHGLLGGGTLITITGAYLGLTTSVTIGGVLCTAVTIVNASTVTAVTPAGTLGNADVVITGGKGTTTVPGGYRYVTILVPSWSTLIEIAPDPLVVTDPVLRAAIEATGLAWRVHDTGTQMEMLLIPPGTFRMGCIMGSNQYGCPGWELPVHQVTLTNAFYLGRYEVMQAQWSATMGENPSYYRGLSDSANRPVEQVSWNNVQNFLTATAMRLPTEAEWEYACRAGTQTPFYNGSTDEGTLPQLAWYQANANNQTHAVGTKFANALGMFDMLGNVWEMSADWYGSYTVEPQINPVGPNGGIYRVMRGASWYSQPPYLWSSTRSNISCCDGYQWLGFRVARNP